MAKAVKRRDPERTRRELLEAGYTEMHAHGFRAASVDRILSQTKLTKGAFFHHFASKNQLGYAVIDEMLEPRLTEEWFTPLDGVTDPLKVLATLFKKSADGMAKADVINGSFLSNLATEMGPHDEEFQEKVTALYDEWVATIEEALKAGKKAKNVNSKVKTKPTAYAIIGQIEGYLALGRATQDPAVLKTSASNFKAYLESLR